MSSIFDPIQPYFVLSSANYYKKIIPNIPKIAHFYRFTSSDILPIMNSVVPDGTADIIFSCDKYNPQAIVAGSVKSASTNIFKENSVYFGVRFAPGAFDHFGGISTKELIGSNADFTDVTGRNDLLEKICASDSFEEQIIEFTKYFGESLSENTLKNKDLLVSDILREIFLNSGNVKISELEKSLNYSRRHLLRVFSDYTGMDIKHFSNIIRFQSTITKMNHGLYPTIADAWADNGYFDQTHFQKDFRKFALMTPKAYRMLIEGSNYLNRITII